MSEFQFNTPEELIADIKAGKLVVIADDENRENEGDLVGAAELITPAQIAFMATQGCGLICVPITAERAAKLNLVTPANLGDRFGTAFTQSVDARDGVTTGISAFDRHAAVQALINDASTPDSLVSPGHSFPLIARPGGVLRRAGHTEAAVDLPRLAGLKPAGVICEIMNPDGTMARMPQQVGKARGRGGQRAGLRLHCHQPQKRQTGDTQRRDFLQPGTRADSRATKKR